MVEKTEISARADSACRASDLTVDEWQQAYLDETSRLEAQLAERPARHIGAIAHVDHGKTSIAAAVARHISDLEATPPAPKVTDEMVLAGCREVSVLFKHGLHSLPTDGANCRDQMQGIEKNVRRILTAALSGDAS